MKIGFIVVETLILSINWSLAPWKNMILHKYGIIEILDQNTMYERISTANNYFNYSRPRSPKRRRKEGMQIASIILNLPNCPHFGNVPCKSH
uniref:Uncharacterized protein ycf15 n=1 Tax=Solanum lycopersicum TaxID=4081 RepID=A0A3Q7FKD3_SOLLC